MLYVIGNYINLGTLSSVSTEDSIYLKENMYDLAQSVPWRMLAKSGNAIFDMGTDVPTILGIMNHNLTSNATITLETAATLEGLDGTFTENVPPHKLNIWHTIGLTPLQWWKLTISDAGNGSNLELGEIILHVSNTFTMNYWWPYKEGMAYVVDEHVTHFGRRHRIKRAKKKMFTLDFEGVTDAHFTSEIEVFFDAWDGDQPFIFIPDDTLTDSWYVECLNSLEAQRIFIDQNKFFLKLEEQSRGITLL